MRSHAQLTVQHLYSLGKAVQMGQAALRALRAGKAIHPTAFDERSCLWFPLFK